MVSAVPAFLTKVSNVFRYKEASVSGISFLAIEISEEKHY